MSPSLQGLKPGRYQLWGVWTTLTWVGGGGGLAWSFQEQKRYGTCRPGAQTGTAHSSLEWRVDHGGVLIQLVRPGTATDWQIAVMVPETPPSTPMLFCPPFPGPLAFV
jgi:hypothetical protein